jgi:predicted ester cyclase
VQRRRHTGSSEEAQAHTKKKLREYRERDEEKHAEYLSEISEVPEEKRYYIDECGINEYLYRMYGYARRGEKIYEKIPGKKYDRVSMVGAKCGKEIIGRYEYKCTMNAKLFELWFCEVLLKEIPPGSVIILDNASWHRKKVLKKSAEEAGCRVIFLPPHSPDFNPIEKVWAALKKFLRHYAANFANMTAAALAFFESA